MHVYSNPIIGLRANFKASKALNNYQNKTDKPFSCLNYRDSVHFGNYGKEKRDDWVALCQSIGISDARIETIKTETRNTDRVKSLMQEKKRTLVYTEEAAALRAEYEKSHPETGTLHPIRGEFRDRAEALARNKLVTERLARKIALELSRMGGGGAVFTPWEVLHHFENSRLKTPEMA
jgi:hypothetical protein